MSTISSRVYLGSFLFFPFGAGLLSSTNRLSSSTLLSSVSNRTASSRVADGRASWYRTTRSRMRGIAGEDLVNGKRSLTVLPCESARRQRAAREEALESGSGTHVEQRRLKGPSVELVADDLLNEPVVHLDEARLFCRVCSSIERQCPMRWLAARTGRTGASRDEVDDERPEQRDVPPLVLAVVDRRFAQVHACKARLVSSAR